MHVIVCGNTAPVVVDHDQEDPELRRQPAPGVKQTETYITVPHNDLARGMAEVEALWVHELSGTPPAWVHPIMGDKAPALADHLVEKFTVTEEAAQAAAAAQAAGQLDPDAPLPVPHKVERGRPEDWQNIGFLDDGTEAPLVDPAFSEVPPITPQAEVPGEDQLR